MNPTQYNSVSYRRHPKVTTLSRISTLRNTGLSDKTLVSFSQKTFYVLYGIVRRRSRSTSSFNLLSDQ